MALTSDRPSMKMAQLSAAYFPHPGRESTSCDVWRGRSTHAWTRRTRLMAHRPPHLAFMARTASALKSSMASRAPQAWALHTSAAP